MNKQLFSYKNFICGYPMIILSLFVVQLSSHKKSKKYFNIKLLLL